ncbi:hypothetical protein OXX80_008497 [Metschnikowia pulcherrima]
MRLIFSVTIKNICSHIQTPQVNARENFIDSFSIHNFGIQFFYSIMLDLMAWEAGPVSIDPSEKVSDDQSIPATHDYDGGSNSEENTEFRPLPESSDFPFYDGLSQDSKETFDRTIINSKSKSLLSPEDYKYYCSVLEEAHNATIDVPNFTSKEERNAFHGKRSRIRHFHQLEGKLLYFVPKPGTRKLVASHDTAFHLLAQIHRPEKAHVSMSKMHPLVSAKIHGLTRNDVKDFVAVCSVCGSARGKSDPPEHSDKNQEEEPFDRLQLDFVDQYHQPSNGFTWILAIRDHLSNFCQLYPFKTKCPSDVADCVDIFIRYFGSPRVIQHNGDHVIKSAISQLICSRGIDLTIGRIRSSIVESSANEFTETVQLKVAAWVIESGNSCWDEAIEQIEMSINTDPYPMVPSLSAYKTVFGTERAEMAVQSPESQLRLDVSAFQVDLQAKRPLGEVSSGTLPDCVSELLSSLPSESSHDIEPSANNDALLERADRLASIKEKILQHQLINRDKTAEK